MIQKEIHISRRNQKAIIKKFAILSAFGTDFNCFCKKEGISGKQ